MKDDGIVKCYICKQEFDIRITEEGECPICDWIWLGWEAELDEDEKPAANPITIREAKQNFAKGLNIWGKTLSQNK